MRTTAIALLSLFALFMLAVNARLRERANALETRLAAAEKKARREPLRLPPAPPPPAVEEAPRAEAVATPVPAPKPPPPPRAADSGAAARLRRMATFEGSGTLASFVVSEIDEDAELGLTEGQKAAIDALRKDRDARIQALTEASEAAIRNLLTPEQLAKRDAAAPQVQVELAEAEPAPSGRPPGYLGIAGENAPGGGARVNQVFEGTSASRLGLRAGDVILGFDGAPLADLNALSRRIRETGEGFAATLRIRRDGLEFDQAVQLGPRPR